MSDLESTDHRALLQQAQDPEPSRQPERLLALAGLSTAPDRLRPVAVEVLIRESRCFPLPATWSFPWLSLTPIILILSIVLGTGMGSVLDPVGSQGVASLVWSVLLLVVGMSGAAMLDAWGRQEAADEIGMTMSRAAAVRRQALESLSQLPGPRSAGALSRALFDPDPYVRATAARGLGPMRIARMAGPLATASRDTSPEVRAAAVGALVETLPRVTEAHIRTIGRQTVPYLCFLLDHRNVAVRRTILEALEKIGDGRACPYVEKAANEDEVGELRMLAARVLPVLLQRRETERNPSLLLRSSTAPPKVTLLRQSEQDPEDLLRPAVAAVAANPQQMLRPAETSSLPAR
jgi:hypothetical protein